MFFKGMTFGFMARNGYYSSEAGKKEIQKLINSGADSIALLVTIMQDSFASTRMYRDFIITPADDELRETIRTFRQAGLKVMLKPILEHQDSTHRGEINFPENQQQISGIVTDYWGEWFKNYTAAMLHYARICELESVEMFCIGCEMTGADRREKYWPPMIDKIRQVYHGLVTYNTPCWWHYAVNQNWIRQWFSKLDMLGISNYYGNGNEYGMQIKEVNTDTIAQGMEKLAKNLDEAYEILKMPIFMAEFGVRSVKDGLENPADCINNHREFDGELQVMYFEGTMRTFSTRKWWNGFFWWKWDEQQDRPHYHHPAGDTGCTIANKPCEKTFKEWVPPVR